MRCSECNGHLYGCPYEDDDIQECDEAQALTRMTELAYKTGRKEAMLYLVDRGHLLLEADELPNAVAMGICLMMGIAQAQAEGENG